MTKPYVRRDYPLSEVTGRIILEDVDFVQTLSYLQVSGYTMGLLLNIGAKQLGIKRIVYETARR